MTAHVSLRWPEELLERIDEARGLVPRAAWIRQACEEKLQGRVGEGAKTGLAQANRRVEPVAALPCPHPKNKRTQLTPKKDRCRACGEVVDR